MVEDMTQLVKRASLFVAIILIALTLSADPPTYVPIAAARQAAKGSTVTVLGRVTVPSGAFRSSSEDEGFAIQDETAGIWVSVKNNIRLVVGEVVLVTGTLGESEAKLQIVPATAEDVKRLPGSGLRVATGRVGPATLGYLITVEGTITSVVPDPPYGHKLFIDDGSGVVQVFLNASTDINPGAGFLKPGRRLRVLGFASQYEIDFEIEPRSRRDLTPK